MEIISNFCTYEEDKEKIIPNFCIVAILFQNIAYTSSANYKKWFTRIEQALADKDKIKKAKKYHEKWSK